MELFEDFQPGCGADFYQPLLVYLREKEVGRTVAPYIPRFSLMSLHKLCQLALLWFESGFVEEAGRLAHWLKQFEGFPTLWCPEEEFKGQNLFPRLSQIPPLAGEVPDLGVTLSHHPSLRTAFTLAGHKTSLGVILSDEVEIRALGPQAFPLTDMSRFGIQGRGLNGWARCAAFPEVWLGLKTECKEGKCKIDLRFAGLTSEEPLFFAFYIKAKNCQIGNERLKPKSLHRFKGEGKEVQLDSLRIESSLSLKMEAIPLAGEGCFWDCEFLILFEVPLYEPHLCFTVQRGEVLV